MEEELEEPVEHLVEIMETEEMSKELKSAILAALDDLRGEASFAWMELQKEEAKLAVLKGAYMAVTGVEESVLNESLNGIENLTNETVTVFANMSNTIH